MNVNSMKCVAIGDAGVGKTSLLLTFGTSVYPTENLPKVVDTFSVPVETEGRSVTLRLFDTEGTQDLNCNGADAIILMFSLVDKDTYDRVNNKWIPILTYLAPNVPIILVGTKLDVRDDQGLLAADSLEPVPVHISPQQGDELKKLIGAAAYVECSAKAGLNVRLVFEMAIRSDEQVPNGGLGLCQLNCNPAESLAEDDDIYSGSMFYLKRLSPDEVPQGVTDRIELPVSMANDIKFKEDGSAEGELTFGDGFWEAPKLAVDFKVTKQAESYVLHMTRWTAVWENIKLGLDGPKWLKFTVKESVNSFLLELM